MVRFTLTALAFCALVVAASASAQPQDWGRCPLKNRAACLESAAKLGTRAKIAQALKSPDADILCKRLTGVHTNPVRFRCRWISFPLPQPNGDDVYFKGLSNVRLYRSRRAVALYGISCFTGSQEEPEPRPCPAIP
jgi:hypothetical protein